MPPAPLGALWRRARVRVSARASSCRPRRGSPAPPHWPFALGTLGRALTQRCRGEVGTVFRWASRGCCCYGQPMVNRLCGLAALLRRARGDGFAVGIPVSVDEDGDLLRIWSSQESSMEACVLIISNASYWTPAFSFSFQLSRYLVGLMYHSPAELLCFCFKASLFSRRTCFCFPWTDKVQEEGIVLPSSCRCVCCDCAKCHPSARKLPWGYLQYTKRFSTFLCRLPILSIPRSSRFWCIKVAGSAPIVPEMRRAVFWRWRRLRPGGGCPRLGPVRASRWGTPHRGADRFTCVVES